MTITVVVLVSLGRHPASGRAGPADRDRRALEMALRLNPARLCLIHAGNPAEPALRLYLGMGADEVTVLDCPPPTDPVPALMEHLVSLSPSLVLTGTRAETGEGSGLIPYIAARRLGATLVPEIVDVEPKGNSAALLQAAPGGRRRRLRAPFPLVVTVPIAAPVPRASAFARARDGRLRVLPATAGPDPIWQTLEVGPARKRPRRLRAPDAGSLGERLASLSGSAKGGGRLMVDPDAETAARAIRDYLVAEAIIDGGSGNLS